MSQPILAIEDAKSSKRITANLLPCRINHDGSMSLSNTHWNPSKSSEDDATGSQTAFFRGRKLLGTAVKLPEDYRGVIVEREPEKKVDAQADADVPAEGEPERGQMLVSGTFDEMVVWGHESTANAQADPYVRSIDEWVKLASEIHGP